MIITKTEADNQSSMTMTEGDVLRVVLESNPSTGSSWNVVDSGGPLKLFESTSIPPATPKPGAPCHEEFRFAPQAVGPASQGGWLRLLYLRPFEQDISIVTNKVATSRDLWQINVSVEPAAK